MRKPRAWVTWLDKALDWLFYQPEATPELSYWETLSKIYERDRRWLASVRKSDGSS